MALPLYEDQEWLVLCAPAERRKSFCAGARVVVSDQMRNVSSDETAITRVNNAGSLPVDFQRQLPFGNE